MREGFELVAMARALIHDPSLIARYQAGEASTSGCIPCNRCVAEMDRPGGVRCARVAVEGLPAASRADDRAIVRPRGSTQ